LDQRAFKLSFSSNAGALVNLLEEEFQLQIKVMERKRSGVKVQRSTKMVLSIREGLYILRINRWEELERFIQGRIQYMRLLL
jgi:hypothetical protein